MRTVRCSNRRSRSLVCRRGLWTRAECADARPRRAAHRLRAHVDEHAGRGMGTAGIRQLQGAVYVFRRAETARRESPQPVRRDRVSSRRSGRLRVDHRWRSGQRAASVQEDRDDAERGIRRFDRRHARIDWCRRIDGTVQIRGAGGRPRSPKGSTSTVFPEYNLTPGVTVETPDNLYVRGSVLKTVLGDKNSPVLYGYDQNALAVYFNQAPVMRVGGGGGFGGGRGGAGTNVPPVGNLTPNAAPPTLTTLDGPPAAATSGGRGGRGRGAGRGAPAPAQVHPRLAGGERSGSGRRAAVVVAEAAAGAAGVSAAARQTRLRRASCCRSRPIQTICCCQVC